MHRTYKDYKNLLNFSSKYSLHFDTDEEWKNRAAGEVLNSNDFMLNSNRHDTSVTAGLYDIKIFGSVDKCYCGKIKTEGYCPYCKTKVLSREEYSKQYAYYQLLYPYSFSNKLKILIRELESVGIKFTNTKIDSSSTKEEFFIKYIWSLSFSISDDKKLLNLLKSDDKYENDEMILYKILLNRNYLVLKISYINNKTPIQEIGLIGLRELSNYMFNGQSLSFINNYLNSIYIISSPANRPPKFTKQKGKVLAVLPEIHITYKIIIDTDKILRENLESKKLKSIDQATLLCIINILIERLTKNQSLLASSKKSLLRSLTSVRLDLTARANISPNNDLKINEIGIPRSALYLALQHQIINIMRESNDSELALNAEYFYSKGDERCYLIMYDILKDSCCLFSRSPVLFKYGVMAFKIVPIEESKPVFQLNPLISQPFNADFDGDQMLVILETDPYLARSYLQKQSPGNIWFYDKGEPLFVPDHEQLVGLCYASNIMKSKNPKKYRNFDQVIKDVEDKKIEIDEEIYINNDRTSYGRYRLGELLGTPLDDIIGENEVISSSNIAKIISGLNKKKNKIDIMNNLLQIADEFATKIGIESAPRMNLYKKINPEIQKILNNESLSEEQKYNQINRTIEELLLKQIKELPNTNFDLIMKSSGRMKMQQLRGLYARRVFMENGNCVVADSEIMSGLIEKDLYNSVYESRQVFKLKKNFVPIWGYNSKQILVLSNNIELKNENSPVTGVIKIPEKNKDIFEGRNVVKKDSNFIYYNSMVGRPFNSTLYINEIRENLFVNYNESNNISNKYLVASFMTELFEKLSQKSLGLKYGADLQSLENEFVTAVFDGEIKEIKDDKLIVVDESNKEWFYIVTKSSQLKNEIEVGYKFKKGDVLINSNNIRLTENNHLPMSEFLGLQIAGGKNTSEEKSLSYAIENNSLISYTDKYMTCGPIRQSINQKLLYKYPNGWRVDYSDRITSGVLDLKKLMTLGKPEDMYFIFYKEFHDIFNERKNWSTIFYSEFLEPLFTILVRTDKTSIRSITKNRKDILDSMYGGSPKQAFRQGLIDNRVDKKTKSKLDFDMTYISDLLLRLGK